MYAPLKLRLLFSAKISQENQLSFTKGPFTYYVITWEWGVGSEMLMLDYGGGRAFFKQVVLQVCAVLMQF